MLINRPDDHWHTPAGGDASQKLEIYEAIYPWPHLREVIFRKVKKFKHIAMRACESNRSFEATIYLAAAFITQRETHGP